MANARQKLSAEKTKNKFMEILNACQMCHVLDLHHSRLFAQIDK